jgi:exopolysaccharide biosynthesis polyprenyl glycosylphosphotransferase
MGQIASQAAETRTPKSAPSVSVPASVRAERLWPRRASRGWRYALLRRMLALADLTAALLATLSLVTVGTSHTSQLAWALAYLPAWIVVAKLLGLYDRDWRFFRHLTVDEAPLLVLWALLAISGLALFLELTPAGRPDASSGVLAGVVATSSVFLLRAVARWSWRSVTPPERVGVVGTRSAASMITRKLELFPDLHMAIVTEHDDLEIGGDMDLEGLSDVDRLVYAPSSLEEERVRAILELARAMDAVLTVVPPCRSAFGPAAQLHRLAELPLLNYAMGDLSRSTLFLKRVLDVAVSAAALVVFLAPFLVIAVAVKLDSRGPVFFSQLRAGQNGRPFRMRKFRTMVTNAEELLPALVPFDELEEPMFKLRDDPRVTRVGRVLRRWSLDELPQLWNVLIGQMSLVGPRPEQLDLVERYAPEHRFRLAVRPGITGPMQVYGRGQLTFAERLAVERDYVEKLSIGRDLRILGVTLAVVVTGRGAF